YGADETILGGLNSFYLLVDRPEVYGLPSNPKVPGQSVLRSAFWAIFTGLLVALGVLFQFRQRTKREGEAPAEPTLPGSREGEAPAEPPSPGSAGASPSPEPPPPARREPRPPQPGSAGASPSQTTEAPPEGQS